jgi:release factor glutamine methyltransferase
MTLDEWLGRAEAQLAEGPHPDRARRDAEALLLHHIGKNRAWLMAHGDEEFAGCRAVSYAAILKRRARGEPIQYITGETEFYGLPFHVTPDVLIPRQETEHLVEKVIALCAGLERPRIVDVGTGSGAIAVAIAHALPQAQVMATDVSDAALAIARGNAQRNGVAERMFFAQGDLLEPVKGELFDVVASNPPYVPEEDRASLDVEVREYEPEQALFGGLGGMDLYRRLIPQAADTLAPGGHIVLEIGYGQRRAIEALLTAGGYEEIEFVPDLQGIARVAVARIAAGQRC